MTRTQKRQAFRRAVQSLLREYVAEGEHQDGIEYWDNFPNAEDALVDFGIYVQNLDPGHLKQHASGTDYFSRKRA